jgi:branched-chain amino acid transport system permease protein
MDEYLVGVLSNIAVLGLVALSAYLLLLVGALSFGQQAFFGIGGYAAGIATALWSWSLIPALVWGAAIGGLAATALAAPTLRLRGVYFAVASLAFAEMTRIALELFRYRIEVDGDLRGPDGTQGFREIRCVFENGITPGEYLLILCAVLAVALVLFAWMERSRLGVALRMIGTDPELAAVQGVPVTRFRVLAACASGMLAALGGGLYAHLTTYVEPRNVDVMLGVHAVAYGLIGGLGTAFGPLLGVIFDIGLLEGTRWFAGFRMIVFGGLVALVLALRPRGILDERAVHQITRIFRGKA